MNVFWLFKNRTWRIFKKNFSHNIILKFGYFAKKGFTKLFFSDIHVDLLPYLISILGYKYSCLWWLSAANAPNSWEPWELAVFTGQSLYKHTLYVIQ